MSEDSDITIVIIDDHQVVREGLKSALTQHGFSIVGQAASKNEAFAQIAHTNPKVILVDLNLPDGSGLDVISWARGISSTLGIVVLTMSDEDKSLLASLQSGANAFISKSAPISHVIAAISQAYLAPQSFTGSGLSDAIKRKRDGYQITARELTVLEFLPKGLTSAAIAKNLFLSEATVKTHLASIYRKLSVTNRAQAVDVALKNLIIT